MNDSLEHGSVRKMLTSTMDDLSNGERKVARALLAQYPSAGLTTVADLASAASVSPPTVIRFATRLGFSGFPALQRSLVHELNAELGAPLKQYPQKNQPPGRGFPDQIHTAFISMLDSTFSEVPESEFNKLSKLLSNPTSPILITGGRFSRLLAEYVVIHLRLLRSGVMFLSSDDLERRAAVADAGPGTVFLVFDYRRYTEASLLLAQQMSHRGATVCLMTDNWMSPIAQVAKVVLPARVDSASPFDSLVAATAIGESLIAAVAARLGRSGSQRLEFLESDPNPT